MMNGMMDSGSMMWGMGWGGVLILALVALGVAALGPHEARSLSGFDPDAVGVLHGSHRVVMAVVGARRFLAVGHFLHEALVLGMLGGRADCELVRIEAVIAHDDAYRLAIVNLEALDRESVIGGDDLDRSHDLFWIARLAAAAMARAVRQGGSRHQRQEREKVRLET